ncbi:MAG: FAD-dependent oxidoreductase, partial [Pseudoflavonifractor sp.]
MKQTKRIITAALTAAMVLSLASCGEKKPTPTPTPSAAPAPAVAAGTYEGETTGMGGSFKVAITLDAAGKITAVTPGKNLETPGVGTVALEQLSAAIVDAQNLEVDSISGATISSAALKNGVTKALEAAGADTAAYKLGVRAKDTTAIEKTADVIIIGGGGAGLAAAVSATDEGASVIVLEKMGILGGNTMVCGGIYNCPDPELQAGVEMTAGVTAQVEAALKETPVNDAHAALIAEVQEQYDAYKAAGSKGLFDSEALFALQTWNGGDKVANLPLVREFADNAKPAYDWARSLGLEFNGKITQGAGSLYQRTHTATKMLGTGYIGAYIDTLAKRTDKCEIMMNTHATELIMDGAKVVGVKAETSDGAPVTLTANKNVILATGGFAGNVELRQKYNTSGKWADLGPKVPTTNMPGVTGDGIMLAEQAGANLIDMEQIQLLQLGNPKLGAITGLNFNNDVRNYLFVNKEGNRFVREDGRRDEICQAILAQTDGAAFILNNKVAIPDPTTTTTKEGMTIAEEEKVGWIYSGATLEELAEKIGVPAENLKATVDAYNAGIDAQKDEFGRTLLTTKLEEGPWYALPRVPSVHHTMGGVQINTDCQALKADGSVVEGLYCAGE